jgi:hypothetical protein
VSVAAQETFVRYVGGSHIHGNEIDGGAFERSPKDADGVSIAIRRIFSKNSEEDIAQIRSVVGARLKLGKTGVFAELNVGTALSVLHEFEESITIELAPLAAEGDWPHDPAHGLILGLPFKGEQIGSLRSELAGDLLARRIIGKYPAIV